MKDTSTHTPPNGPAETRGQLVGKSVPVTPVAVKLTAPVGVETPGPLVSVTNTIQNVPWLVDMEVGTQPMEVEVVLVPSDVTVTPTVVGAVVAPRGEPVTLKLYEPGGTDDATLTSKLLVMVNEEGVTGLTLKEPHVMPSGRDELTHDNMTG